MISALLVAASIVSGQVADTTIQLPRDGRISIEGNFTSVRIETATGNQVTVRGAGARLRGNELTVERSILSAMHRDRGTGNLHLTVPTWARVRASILEGGIEVTGALESLEAEVISGSIAVRGGTGTMSLVAINGPVTVRDFKGTRLEIEALNDRVEVDGATGTINVNVVNGGVAFRNVRSSSVTVESVNGNLGWQGPLEPNGSYWFSSHNGSVILRLPVATSATVTAKSVMGNITSNLATIGRGERGQGQRRSVTFVIGSGSADVNIETFSGNIRVDRP